MTNPTIWYRLCQILIIAAASLSAACNDRIDLYKIEGRIVFPSDNDDIHSVRILVDEGQYVGIPRIDGTFVIADLPSGSYVVSVNSPFHVFKPVRVDITSKGKVRAREVDYIQPGRVVMLKYPLHFDAHEKKNYFEQREKIRWTDIIWNPMFQFMIMGIPLLLMLSRSMPQGEEMEETMRQTNNFLQPNVQLPDIVGWIIDHFGGPRRRLPVQPQPRTDEGTTVAVAKEETKPKRTRNRKR